MRWYEEMGRGAGARDGGDRALRRIDGMLLEGWTGLISANFRDDSARAQGRVGWRAALDAMRMKPQRFIFMKL